jgi:hypothetical protein
MSVVQDPDSESGGRREKITDKNRKKVRIFMIKCWMCFLRAKAFSC